MSDTQPHYQAPLPQGPVEEGQVILRDGSTAELRPARLEDETLVKTFLQRVSKDARVHRFFGDVSPDLGAAQLLKLGPPEERAALLVLTGGPAAPKVIAHGSYSRDAPDADAAEVAFLVDDRYQGKGLGTLLLERLALQAARHGVRHFYGPTEALNRPMRDLFRASGFPVQETRDGRYVDVSFSILPTPDMVGRFELRERVATVASLRPFFKPQSVAVIGASRQPGSIGHRILDNLVTNRFVGPVYAVNPKAERVGSVQSYPSVKEVPGPVELAIITVPQPAVSAVVDDCGAKGVRSLLVITAGFAETGAAGREAQDALLTQARGYGMRLVGPNCLGLLNTDPEVRLNASFSTLFPPPGPIAMSSQSGALGLAVLELTRDLGLGMSSFVSLGNKADVSGNDLLQYWEEDPETGVILLYLESFGNPRRFARLARRVGRKKPIVAVKAGRSQAGGRAASSHTAALAASEVGVDALFRQTGVIRAETLEEMFDVASLLAGQPLPTGPKVAVLTNAGGPAILAVDALSEGGLELPDTPPEVRAKLETFLPAAASLGNPVDMIASAGAAHYRQTLQVLLQDPGFDAVLCIYIPVGLAETEDVTGAIAAAVAEAHREGIHKPALVCLMTAPTPEDTAPLRKEHLPNYRFPEAAAKALVRSYGYAKWRRTPLGVVPEHADLDVERARAVCGTVKARGGGWLSAPEVETVLGAFGLPMLEGKLAADPDQAVAFAEVLGYPVVVKLASSTLVHKSEWNGVQVDLKDAAAVRRACKAIQSRLDWAGKGDELDGFLVQRMVPGGVELMVGVTDDPLFGPLLAFGLGGVHVEVLRDVVFRVTPLTDRDAEEMLTGIRGYKLLQGYRGAPEADLGAVKDLLLRVSRLVEDVPEITELDLNPVKALEPGEGCVILDARIRCA